MAAPKIISYAPKVDGFKEDAEVINSLKGWKHSYWCASENCAAWLAKYRRSNPSQRVVTHDSETPPSNVHCRVVFNKDDKGLGIEAGGVCNSPMTFNKTYVRVARRVGA